MNLIINVNRSLAVIISILLVAISGYGLKFLYSTTDYKAYFTKDNRELQYYEKMQDEFTKNETIFAVLSPKDGSIFTPKNLSVIENFVEKSWYIPYSTRVDAITNFQYTSADGDDLSVEPLIENAKSFTEQKILEVREIALNDARLKNRLVNEDGSVAGILITIQLPGKDESELQAVMNHVNEIKNEVETTTDFAVYLTGIIPQSSAFIEVPIKESSTLVPLMFLLIFIATGMFLRSIIGFMSTIIIVLFSLVSGLGMAGWFNIGLTAASIVSIYIILMIAVANCVHVIVSTQMYFTSNNSKNEAIKLALENNISPIFFTSLTTAIGFLSLNFSNSPPYQDLGNIVAMGVCFALFYALVLLPAILKFCLRKPSTRFNQDKMSRFWHSVANFVINRHKQLLASWIVLTIMMVFFITTLTVNDRYIEWFDETIELRLDSDFIDKKLPVLYTLEFSLPSGSSGGIADPAYLNHLAVFSDWLYEQPEINNVTSLLDIIKQINKTMNNDDETYYAIPADKTLIAQYLLLYELSLPYGLDLTTIVDIDKSKTRVVASLPSIGSRDILKLEDRANKWIKENLPSNMHTIATGYPSMYAHLGIKTTIGSIEGAIFALLLISGVLIFVLKSWQLGLISIVPNIVPAVIAFGVWAMAVSEVGLALATVMSMALGIMVDDTVHFLWKYRYAKQQMSLSNEDSIRYAFSNVGRALWTTSFVLVVGFLVLATSSFSSNSDKAILTSLTLVIALLVDFLFLPALLMVFDKKKAHVQTQNDIKQDGKLQHINSLTT